MKCSLSVAVFLIGPLVALSACGTSAERPDVSVAAARDSGAAVEPEASSADRVEIVRGVADRGRDPAVVAIVIGEEGLCTGTLVSPKVVLTARHCVSRTVTAVECPPASVQVLGERDPRSLAILQGDDVESARVAAHGQAILTPSGVTLCGADIAYIVLDRAVQGVKPLLVRQRGPAVGDRLRAVGYGRSGDRAPAGEKLLREHVRVLAVENAEFSVGEVTCQGDSGGPALDEETGEVAGIVSRGGPTCEGPNVHNVYTRVDAFGWLLEEALAKAGGVGRDEDAGKAAPAPPGTKQKPPSDIGGPCEKAADCAAGVCVSEGARKYCSRSCGAGDRCPARYNCRSVGGASVCVNVR